jgi:hypothetical protein
LLALAAYTHRATPASRDKFAIHSKAVVCQDVELKGDITIGAGARSLPRTRPPRTV